MRVLKPLMVTVSLNRAIRSRYMLLYPSERLKRSLRHHLAAAQHHFEFAGAELEWTALLQYPHRPAGGSDGSPVTKGGKHPSVTAIPSYTSINMLMEVRPGREN